MFVTQQMLQRGYYPIGGATSTISYPQAVTVAHILAQTGYLADPQELISLSQPQAEALVALVKVTGTLPRNHRIMYKGFPQQVLEASDAELFITALKHYSSFGTWLPMPRKKFRRSVLSGIDLTKKLIPLSSKKFDLFDLEDLWSHPLSFSQQDHAYQIALAQAFSGKQADMFHKRNPLHKKIAKATFEAQTAGIFTPANLLETFNRVEFLNGENFAAAITALRGCDYDKAEIFRLAAPKARHVDDLLRAAIACFYRQSWDLLSLDINHLRVEKTVAIPRAARRLLLATLSIFDDPRNLDLLVRRRSLWRNVFKSVHPYDVAGHHTAQLQLDVIFDQVSYRSMNSQVEIALAAGQPMAALDLLRANPGSLTRRIQHLMRLTASAPEQQRQLLDTVLSVCPKARLTTIISAYNALRNRDADVRVTRLLSWGPIVRKPKPDTIPADYIDEMLSVLRAVITLRLQNAPAPTGPVACGDNNAVELERRSLSHTSKILARGTRLKLDFTGEDAVIRLFLHWVGLDVDLGVVFADDQLRKKVGYFDYTNLSRSPLRKAVMHSGDITLAPPPTGAAEFIDIRVTSSTDRKLTIFEALPEARYVIASLISYSGLAFSQIKNYAGVMMRSDAMAGEIFEPLTIETALQVCNSGTSSIPFVVDLHAQELIWLDTSLGSRMGLFSAGHSQAADLVRAELAALSTRLTNGELLGMWADAHGVAKDKTLPGEDVIRTVQALFRAC